MAGLTRRHCLALARAVSTVAVFAPAMIPESRAEARDSVDHQVEITGFKFVPGQLKVRPGDTITWINRDISPHTATAQDKSWDTGTVKKDAATSILITPDFATDYYCRFHPMMKARIEFDIED